MKCLALLMLVLCGCAVNRTPITLNFNITELDRQEAKRAIDSTYAAMETLEYCNYFRDTYPYNYRFLLDNIKPKGFTVTRATDDEIEVVLIKLGIKAAAYTMVEDKTIRISRRQLFNGASELDRTVAHELLHIALMPNHHVPQQQSDAIIVTLKECGFKEYK